MFNQPGAAIDYDRLMQANLASVFNERGAEIRIRAIGELYAEGAVLYEPPDTAAEGHAAISEAVTRLLASLPPDFAFTATGPALGHHGIGRLRWQAGPPNGPVAVNGMDVAHFRNGRIHSLYVFVENHRLSSARQYSKELTCPITVSMLCCVLKTASSC